jgi:hypothetical protein
MILLHWPLCRCYDGAIAIVAQVPLPLLHWCCCPCCTGIVAFIFAGIVAIVALALSQCCPGIVNMPVGPPLSGILSALPDLPLHTQAIVNTSHVIWIGEESFLFYKQSKAH